MTKLSFRKTLIIIILYYVLYSLSVAFGIDLLTSILSPVGAFLSFLILIAYGLKKQSLFTSIFFILCGFACLSWTAGDMLWAFYHYVFGLDPNKSVLLVYIYLFTNIFLIASGLVFSYPTARKWNVIQLILDVTAVTSFALILLWILVFNKSFELFEIIIKDGFASVLSLLIDFLILIGTIIWQFSVRTEKKPLSALMMSGAMCLFAATDIYYYYLHFYNLYAPNEMIDNITILSFLLMALSAAFKSDSGKELRQGDSFSNIGVRRRGLLLLVAPVLLLLFKGFDLYYLLEFGLIILVYEIFSNYIQNAIKNRQLLDKEKEINLLLEQRIADDTVELVRKNLELTEKNKRLDFLSNQDIITGLYNRRYFISRLDKMLAKISPPSTISLMYIDLDRFKTINDTYGHDVGDKVLIVIANRLDKWRSKDMLLARLGGDEFVFVFRGKYDYDDISKIACDIIRICNAPILIEQYTFHISISIGISIYPLDASDSSSLMKNADIAMYQAKELGFNKYISFNSGLSEKHKRKNEIEILLKKADFDKEFNLHYQPQFSIPDKRLIGIEALLRWNNPVLGAIPPAEFIPIAEEIDYIIPIGEWVMREAIRQIAKWNNAYSSDIKMGFNISAKQLDNVDFVNNLKKIMEDNAVDSKWLDFEITESVALEGVYSITEIANLFKGIGVSISLDDFGTGYSSLSNLRIFPFERIKIAKPLIDSISTDKFDMEIVKSIITLAKTIDIRTVAEGVVTKEQYDLLVKLGCEVVQGYYLGKPVPSDEFEKAFLALI